MKKEKKKELPKANYGDATPEDVARAFITQVQAEERARVL